MNGYAVALRFADDVQKQQSCGCGRLEDAVRWHVGGILLPACRIAIGARLRAYIVYICKTI